MTTELTEPQEEPGAFVRMLAGMLKNIDDLAARVEALEKLTDPRRDHMRGQP